MNLRPVEEGRGARSLDLQALAAFPNDFLSLVAISCHHSRGSTGQHGDLQNVPPLLDFGSESAVQQQFVRCVPDG
eukprot:5267535-Amphidinium_carterae.1